MKIRGNVLRLYKDLHTWVGICAGIVLFIGFFAGALSMFKPAIDDWATPPSQQLKALPLLELEQRLPALRQQYPALNHGFELHLSSTDSATLSWSQAAASRRVDLNAEQAVAGLNAQGEFQVVKAVPSQLAALVDLLHRTAGIPGGFGHEMLGVLVMGVASALYFLALVSGLILLLPTLVKDFFSLRQSSNKRFWLDTHNLLGITSFPFHVLISLSVVVFAFHDIIYDSLQHTAYGQKNMFSFPKGHHDKSGEPLPLTHLVAKTQAAAAGFKVGTISVSGLGSPRASVRASAYSDRYFSRGATGGFVSLNPYSGKVVMRDYLPESSNAWGNTVNSFFTLHFGSFGGPVIKWVYFLLGLAGAGVFYTGNLLWLENRRKRQQKDGVIPKQSLASRVMAALTVGCCLGSVAGVAGAMLAGKWLQAWVANINDWYLGVYYLLFLGFVAFSLVKGAASNPILLNSTALLALAVPLSSLLAAISGYSWPANTLATASVDATVLVAAALLFWLAKIAKRRQQPDSVWG
ncbi:PepSY-associated TM helix domain-containing protein [Gallaecimonas mangrovi]|uniref:PepSY-associated TM helix domain-containing protein n=1 Tax=Gallaecimonas mangrovi TaxID=2291597 RepID=UPI000E2030BC|nr:PepSY-associated TM helix domain-containing protein [Gallaecimonas mangrovi]